MQFITKQSISDGLSLGSINPESISAQAIIEQVRLGGITHIVSVPDTAQKSLIERLEADREFKIVRAATEDDVFAICAGLWIGGARPLALIQQLGLFAGTNALRAFTHDVRTPIAVLAGLYGRDTSLRVDQSTRSSVRLVAPLLAALETQALLIEHEAEIPLISEEITAAFETISTRVLLLGAPTS